MNYPIWELTKIGGPTLIAVISVLHVFISHIAVGGGLFIFLTDLKGCRENNPEIHDYVRRHTWFFLLTSLVLGAVTGVGIWFIIALVSPEATSVLIHVFVFGWAIEWVFFIGEIIALLIYHYNFHRLPQKSRLTLAFLYFFFAWMSLFVINGIIGFMLTPGGWLETHNFWDGFFNPTYWPQLFFRTFIAFMFAGLFGYLTTVYTEHEHFRRKMLKYCTKWLLLPFLGLIPTAIWYFYSVPAGFREISFVLNRSTENYLGMIIGASIFIFMTGIMLSVFRFRALQRMAAFFLIPVGLLWMGVFEYSRETARKPYVIAQHLYSNSIFKADVPRLDKEGILKNAKWTTIKEITPENKLEAGREIFNLECLSCHTVNGVRNDIIPLTQGFPYRGMVAQLTGMGKIRGYMPPFIGTEEEKEALALYISTVLNEHEVVTKVPSVRKTQDEDIEIPPFDGKTSKYVLLVWNDLGMHCISDADSRFSFLPPANTLEAQLIKRGELPERVTEGVEIHYSVEDGYQKPWEHVDFWKFAEPLYGAKNLEQGMGLAGNGLTGTFKVLDGEDVFQAKWIPVVPYKDDGTYNPYPYFNIEAKDKATGEVLAQTKVVAPVSTEQHCHLCHGGTPGWNGVTGISDQTADNILKAHDRNSGTNLYEMAKAGKPQLCQSCHPDPAVESEGKEGVLGLSASIHGWHASYMSDLNDETCVMCHPVAWDGVTKCMRGVHGSLKDDRVVCSRCHGNLEDMAISLLKQESDNPKSDILLASIKPRLLASKDAYAPRTPWLQEPKCLACHEGFQKPKAGSTAFNQYNDGWEDLYRNSTDNGLIRCIACHNSTHAEYPADNPYGSMRDNVQPLQYGGQPYTIGGNMTCSVCHTIDMEYPIHHENMDRMVRNTVKGYEVEAEE